MLKNEKILIHVALESILNEHSMSRDEHLEKLSSVVEELFGDTREGQTIAEVVRSWIDDEKGLGLGKRKENEQV